MMERKWFVCFCPPAASLRLVEAMKGVRELECPSFTFRRRVPRRNKVETLRRPLIGGIFFCEVNSWPIGEGFVCGIYLPEIKRMEDGSGNVAVVSDAEIDELRMASDDESAARTHLFVGDEVEIVGGPFYGEKAIVAGLEDGGEVVSLEHDWLQGAVKIRSCLLRKTGRD